MKKIVATMVSLEQQQTADDESKEAASDIKFIKERQKFIEQRQKPCWLYTP
ncbi:hypothetical protein QT341_19785 [Escherichia coli]|nr:hypothetical protein [Escherichia coli]